MVFYIITRTLILCSLPTPMWIIDYFIISAYSLKLNFINLTLLSNNE